MISHVTVAKARRFYPFLAKRHLDDVLQTARLVAVVVMQGPGLGSVWETRIADRELYRLARELGYRRPSAGLARGRTGRWVQDAVPMREEEE